MSRRLVFFQSAPVPGEGVHGGVEVVFVEVLVGSEAAEAAARRVPWAVSLRASFEQGKRSRAKTMALRRARLRGVPMSARRRSMLRDFQASMRTARPPKSRAESSSMESA